MSSGNSRQITTNQQGPHDKIEGLVRRHLGNNSQKPYSQHTLDAFNSTLEWLGDWQGPIILDACCGVGESTSHIAEANPQARVIGVDKSALRTNKHVHYESDSSNYCIVRADLNDYWRLAREAKWALFKHYLLYPNPYPKSAHVQRRWHASAAFADILALGGELTIRSNWRIYIEEVSIALQVAGYSSKVVEYTSEKPMTPFERKYWSSGQQTWQVCCDVSTRLPSADG